MDETREKYQKACELAAQLDADDYISISKHDLEVLVKSAASEAATCAGLDPNDFVVTFGCHHAPFPDMDRIGEVCCVYSVGVKKRLD